MTFLERQERNWTPEPNTGCYLWLLSTDKDGYGTSTEDGVRERAHRRSFEDANGKGSAKGFVIRHRCDNPPCINPDHLIKGATQDNVRDRVTRDRTPHSENASHARLTNDQARAIKQGLARGERQIDLAAEHSVSQATISNIAVGLVWKRVAA